MSRTTGGKEDGDGGANAESGGQVRLVVYDPTFSRDHTARNLWLGAAVLAVAAVVLLMALRSQYSTESRHYLVSAAAQGLAAVLALTVPLPLIFAGLSGYVAGEARLLVRHPTFCLYAGLYGVAMLFNLFLLRHEYAPSWLIDAALAATAVCLLTLLPYVVWVAQRLDPLAYIRRAMQRAIRLSEEQEDVSPLHETLGLVVQAAGQAARNGVSIYWCA